MKKYFVQTLLDITIQKASHNNVAISICLLESNWLAASKDYKR